MDARLKAGLPLVVQLEEPGFALKPLAYVFKYPKSELCDLWTTEIINSHPLASLPAELVPPPPAVPTDGREYPQSTPWTLRSDN